MEGLENIKIESVEQSEESIPTEEYYYVIMSRWEHAIYWDTNPVIGDPRNKKEAIDTALQQKKYCPEVKIIKIKMPVIINKPKEV